MKKGYFNPLILIAAIIIIAFLLLNNGWENETNNSQEPNKDEVTGQESTMSSDVFLVENTDGTNGGFDNLIGLMAKQNLNLYKTDSTPNGLIDKGDVIIIKINGQWDQRGGTNTDLLKSIINSIIEHPNGFEGEIVVADNGQAQYGAKRKGGSMDWKKNNAKDKDQSVQKVVNGFSDSYKVSASLWDEFTTKEVNEYVSGDYEDGFILSDEPAPDSGLLISYPKFTTPYGTNISFKEGIWDKASEAYDSHRLKIINVPVLKSHLIYYVTASVKNYMGTTSDKLTQHNAHNSVGVGGMGTQMAQTRMPVLNILDAIYINPYPLKGPSTPYASGVQTNTVMASTDPIALDYWAVKNILIPKAEELGDGRHGNMNPDGREPGTFGYWLKKSMEEIKKIGYSTTMDEDKINVYKYNH